MTTISDKKKSSDDSIQRIFNWSIKFYQKFMGLSVTGELMDQ